MTIQKAELIADIRAIVRESAYHIARLHADNVPKDEAYSRNRSLHDQLVQLLKQHDLRADEFMARTY